MRQEVERWDCTFLREEPGVEDALDHDVCDVGDCGEEDKVEGK